MAGSADRGLRPGPVRARWLSLLPTPPGARRVRSPRPSRRASPSAASTPGRNNASGSADRTPCRVCLWERPWPAEDGCGVRRPRAPPPPRPAGIQLIQPGSQREGLTCSLPSSWAGGQPGYSATGDHGLPSEHTRGTSFSESRNSSHLVAQGGCRHQGGSSLPTAALLAEGRPPRRKWGAGCPLTAEALTGPFCVDSGKH